MNKKFKVLIIESERDWGVKIDDERYFDTEIEALQFIEEFNKQNDGDVVPSIYWYATKSW
ncbi:hypothetical protein VmeM32_00044 [Vibrio phage vB_VmeM-32]|nr:hypothetical protein VmeM32_00044 [Vibrio phage vB_VmeM-32]